ncbi:hypothetical protein GHT06_012478 [Daphnia sinensis]|uniref:CHK kinase-like domain-containing protein n=1 Tax=Daphnia sinensis TaxID=1820382 RepID=A0AAD5KXN1_9CRUS|nr:hypothetical protein GHT06_012478 [Daphnia sinensis]
MTRQVKSLADRQLFWKTLFETKKLAAQLASLATDHIDGVTYDDLPHYGRVHVVAESASSLGDNFMSDTFIVTAQLTASGDKTQTLSTFIKVLPTNALLRQAAYEAHTHHREINMYHHFFGLLREMHADQPIPLDVPDVYHTHIEEMVKDGTDGSGICTLLEDLKAQGYRMASKALGADYRHCHMALTSLAHFHALTLNAVRKWTDPATGELSNMPPTVKFLVEEKTMYDMGILEMVQDNFKNIVEFAEEVNRPDLVEWLTEMEGRLPEIITYDTKDNCGPLKCILHGDFWNNNMLFKYEDDGQHEDETNVRSSNIPIALKMIDFQISRIGHPISDILYFMYSSAAPETREKHMLVLLRYYFDMLTTDLRLLGISIDDYTWQDFVQDYKRRSLTWMFMGIVVLSFVLNKKVLTKLDDLDAEERLKEPKPESDVEPEKGASGMTLELEETMKNMMKSHKLSDNPTLSDRLLRLIVEVKALNNC